MKLRTFLPVVSLLVAAWALPSAGESVSTFVADAVITARIETLFLLNEHLSPFNINTTTVNGVVTLSGSVEDEVQKDLAGGLAASVEGVKRVTNELTVVPTPAPASPRRSWRERVDDVTISASVRTRLLYHKELKGLRIGVKTQSGVVTLSGLVDSEGRKEQIAKIASGTRGVKRVINDLTVGSGSRPELFEQIGRTISDEWVEKRVETSLLLDRHINIRDVGIEVANGRCILTGTVDSEAQKELAESLACHIQGVEHVQNELRVQMPEVVLDPIEPLEELGASAPER